jgi:uncharacterized protein YoxC
MTTGVVTLDFLGERVAVLTTRVARLESQVQVIVHRLDRLESSIATVDDHVAGVIAEMHRRDEETTRRFDMLETLIREIRETQVATRAN